MSLKIGDVVAVHPIYLGSCTGTWRQEPRISYEGRIVALTPEMVKVRRVFLWLFTLSRWMRREAVEVIET